jgi:hypothetical protein
MNVSLIDFHVHLLHIRICWHFKKHYRKSKQFRSRLLERNWESLWVFLMK